MKKYLHILTLSLLPIVACAQKLPTGIAKALGSARSPEARYHAHLQAYDYFAEKNRDSALYHANKTADIARQANQQLSLANTLDMKAYQLTGSGHYADALKNLLQAFEICNDTKNAVPGWLTFQGSDPEKIRLITLSFTHHIYAILMERTQNTGEEILHYKISKNIGKQIRFIRRILYADVHLGPTYLELGKNDSARMFAEEASRLALQLNEHNYLGNILGCMGDIALKTGALAKAKQYYYEGASEDEANGNIYDLTNNYLKITNFYLGAGQKDSSLHYALKTLKTFRTLGPTTGLQVNIGLAYELLYKSYQLRRQTDSAYKYSTLTLAAKDSVNRSRLVNLSDFQNLSLKEQMRVQYLEKEKVIYQARIRTYAMLIALLVLLIIALIFYRNYRHKQKANKILENTLAELKSTQTQLVQREKMASLGELTAGIAHEIQNPLNFVNNFSEVSAELVDEMEQELDKGEVEEAKAIANDVKQNLEKIRHHGKRADAIVKGMLEHSRVGTGERVPSDINVLAEEFMRLSYHGLRAKDKEFNAELITNFDAGLPKANVVPQDISRVLLNLFNNAFYAVNQKMKTGGPDYKPMVEVSTFVPPSGGWGLKVKDNGNGIPDDIKEKIMQPFFTTKPTGEGTGLGLSLSYDIVVKGHGGIISVNSVEGEGTEFIITIP